MQKKKGGSGYLLESLLLECAKRKEVVGTI